jgi:Ca2+-binding EF-hand superfamily protein
MGIKREAFRMSEQPDQRTYDTDGCKVTKSQVIRFIEQKFEMADRDHDGQLDIGELTNFIRFVTHPDLRGLRSWNR